MPQNCNGSPLGWQLQTIKIYLTLGGRPRAQSHCSSHFLESPGKSWIVLEMKKCPGNERMSLNGAKCPGKSWKLMNFRILRLLEIGMMNVVPFLRNLKFPFTFSHKNFLEINSKMSWNLTKKCPGN